MDCNQVQDKLVDYIDRTLSDKEEKIIFNHLKTCENCRQEHEELQSTINYIVKNSNNINTKDISLHTKIVPKRNVRFTKTALIAALISISLVVTVFAATDAFDFLKWWEKSSEQYMSAWEKLIENGVGEKLDISVVDNDIKVTAEGVIADELNTLIILKIENLKENIKLTPLNRYNEFDAPLTSISIGGDISADSLWSGLNYVNLYSKDENTVRILLKTDPIKMDRGNIDINITSLTSAVDTNKDNVININGNWKFSIPINVIKSKMYNVNKAVDLSGMELIIESVEVAATVTSVNYTIKKDKNDNRAVEKITFLIENNSKTYDDSELTALYNFNENSDGSIEGTAFLDSIYLESPDSINLVVETLRYAVEDLKEYELNLENLPQVLEYNGSHITIEEILYNEDNVEIIVKEDDINGRDYIRTIFDIKENYESGPNRGIESLEWILMDENGVYEESDEFWNNKISPYFLKWKITIPYSYYNKNVYGSTQDLVPEKFYINGQDYIDYPNMNIDIDLR